MIFQVMLKLITLVVITKGQTCHFSRFLKLPSTCVAINWVRAAAIIMSSGNG